MNMNGQSQNQSPSNQAFARPGFFLSQDKNWVKVVHHGEQVGLFHRNFFLKLLDIPFTPSRKEEVRR